MSRTASTPALVHRAAVLVDPALEHGQRALLLGIDGLDHDLLGSAERGGSRGGEEERGSAQRIEELVHHRG